MKRERGDAAEQARVGRQLAANREEGLGLFAQLVGAVTPHHAVPVRAHLRTVKGPETPSGQERKEAALGKLEAGNAEVIAWLRVELRGLYVSRRCSHMSFPSVAYLTADDIHALLHDNPTWSHKLEGPQQWRAAVWKRGFEKIKGLHVPSLRKNQHAALLQAWRPRE